MAAPTPALVATWAPTGRKLTYPWTWVDITSYVRSASVRRGRQSELDDIKPGDAKLVLENTNRIFDPANSAGTYYGDLARGRPLRLATGYRYKLDALNPLTYLPLDEASGSTFTDMRSLVNGALGGSDITYGVQGPLTAMTDGAIDINTASGTTYITQAHNAAFAASQNVLSISAWVRFDAVELNHTIYSKGWTGGLKLRVDLFGGITALISSTATTIAATTGNPCSSQNGTTWYHIVYTKNGTGAGASEIYVNGVAQTLSTDAAVTINDTGNSTINWGRGYETSTPTYGNYMDGDLAHLAIWDRVLSPTEVAALYATYTSPQAAIFTGLTEDVPQDFRGHDATVEMHAVDALAFMAEDTADDASTYAETILDDTPWGYWRMTETTWPEGAKAMVVADHSGNGRHARHNSTSVAIGGAPLVGATPSVSYPRADSLGVYTCVNESAAQLDPPVPPFTFEFWVQFDSIPASEFDPDFGTVDNPLLCMITNPIGTAATQYGILLRAGLRFDEPTNSHASQCTAFWFDWTDDPQSGDGSNEIDSEGYTAQPALMPYEQAAETVDLFDGRPHLVNVVVDTGFPASNNFFFYVDGVEQEVWGATVIDAPMRDFIGQVWTIRWGEQLGGRMSEVALYEEALSEPQIAAHYAAGTRDWSGDLAGERIGHLLDGVGWPDLLRDLDAGTTECSLFSVANQPAAGLMEACALADDGMLYMDGRGYVTFVGRRSFITDSRFSTAQVTFTDQRASVTSGSVHTYLPEAFTYNVDRKLLQNVVKAEAVDPSIDYYRVADPTSIEEQGQSAESVTIPVTTRTDLKGWADTRLALYKDPLLRFQPLVVYPDDHPAAHRAAGWQKLLGLDLGHAVTTIRTPRTGSSISLTSRVEQIEHEIGPDFWRFGVAVSARQTGETIWTLGTSALGAAKITW